ncbi:hypothetical protein Dsin_026104 [Dipteronia sinensis]|uniref:Uncharacterized protein n=1 Tax=Dipteronia sinensis TaxID=43782 RepID=A0AAE0DYZ1_9ROSI|nr:hypothetical protein Dsin_026104 [Dipteronia sinensis]
MIEVENRKACNCCQLDGEKGEKSGGNGSEAEKTMSVNEAEALKKCLEENKGEDKKHDKCKSKVEAFQSTSSPPKKPQLWPLLRSGSLTDV